MILKKLIDRQNRWLETPGKRAITNKEALILTTCLMAYGFCLGYCVAKDKAEDEKFLAKWEDLYDAPDGNIVGDRKIYTVEEIYLNKTVTVFGHEFKYRKRIR